MADFNDNSQKGSVLMQQALKKYARIEKKQTDILTWLQWK